MSKPLKNERHERFAQELAKGTPQLEAYVAVGYAADEPNASRLAARKDVRERVNAILNRAAVRAELTVASITRRLLTIADQAEGLDNAPGLNVARQSLMDAAKLNGLVVESSEVIARTPEERAARLSQLRAERDRLARAH